MTDRAGERTPDTGHAFQGGTGMSALEAAAALGLSERTIRRAIAHGYLNAVKRGGVYRIAPDDLARYDTWRNVSGSLAPRHRPHPQPPILLSGRARTRPFNVPRPLTPLLGRERELEELRARLLDEDVQLVTLTGPGGVGKTRLAIEAATTLRDAFDDGVWFIDLLPLTDPARVASAIARALGIRDTAGRSLIGRLSAFLARREALLILDNFERVADAAPLLVTLLGACPRLKVLVTSRVSLHVSGERQFPVSPLECPDASASLTLAEAASSGAVRLFVTRAEAAWPEFELTEANMAAVAAICQRLDGLPLAIELAAARAKHLNPPAMLTRLNRRLELLTGGMRDQPARMQSMRDAVAWSYDLLTPGEQRLFRRLSVFVNGFTLGAAVAVGDEDEPGAGNQRQLLDGDPAFAPPGSPSSVLDGVISLIDKSLVEHAREPVGEPRFTMLETLREYGLERLEASGERDVTQRRHTAWCLALVESVEAERVGLAPPAGGDRLGPDRDNVRFALQWLRDRGEASTGLRLASALWPLWLERGEVSEGRAMLAAFLALPGASSGEPARARALCVTGALAQALGDHDQAAELSREALIAFQHLGDVRGEAFALNTLGLDAMIQGDNASADAFLRDSLDRFRSVADPRAGAWALRHLSSVAFRAGDVTRAVALAEEGLAIARLAGRHLDVARLLLNLAHAATLRSDLERAEALGKEALDLFQIDGDRWGVADALQRLGQVVFEQGELARAAALLDASHSLFQEIGDPEGLVSVVVLLGWLHRAQGSPATAEDLIAEGLAIARRQGNPSRIASALLGHGALALDRGDRAAAGAAWKESLRLALA
ncbi:MAG: tetratricopeptide repeat protein, partial [Chloroflexia bacterium]|nr:tetratricopeptide repeat protein [Chloroflexia bacterium]